MNIGKILLLIVITFLIASCSIEKRHYMPGYYVNLKFSKNNTVEKIIDDEKTENFQGDIEVTKNEQENYPLITTTDSLPVIVRKKIATYYTTANDTLKSKPKKTPPKKGKKTIDPKKDSKTSLLLGIFANCLFLFGMALLIFSLSYFSYILYMLAMLSIIAALIFVIIGLTKAIKVLQYLKSNPEDTKKNKRKATIGFILNLFILTIPLAYLALIILALGT